MSHTVGDLLALARNQLAAMDEPGLEASLLLAKVLDRSREYLITWPENPVAQEQAQHFLALVNRRLTGEPIAYILGCREFWSLELQVNSSVLIPRPETELLVESVLEQFAGRNSMQIADLGTGSGAIALALASEQPGWQLTAADLNDEGLECARDNAVRLGFTNIRFIRSDWCDALADCSFDIIVSNPPYIAESDPHLSRGDLRFEPRAALVSGADGLDDIRLLAHQAGRVLKPGGWLFVEHGYDQGRAVCGILAGAGYEHILTRRDYGGNDRVTGAQWQHEPD